MWHSQHRPGLGQDHQRFCALAFTHELPCSAKSEARWYAIASRQGQHMTEPSLLGIGCLGSEPWQPCNMVGSGQGSGAGDPPQMPELLHRCLLPPPLASWLPWPSLLHGPLSDLLSI